MMPPTGDRQYRGTVIGKEEKKLTVAESNLPRRPDAASDVPAQVRDEPAHDHRHGAVGAARHQEERAVLHVPARHAMDVQQDRKPGDRDADRDQAEGEAVPQPVREVGDQHGEAERRRPRRDRVQLRRDRLRLVSWAAQMSGKGLKLTAIAIGLDDGWRKVGVSCGAVIRTGGLTKLRITRRGRSVPYAGTIRPKYINPPTKILSAANVSLAFTDNS